jgi:hypothetical protein
VLYPFYGKKWPWKNSEIPLPDVLMLLGLDMGTVKGVLLEIRNVDVSSS